MAIIYPISLPATPGPMEVEWSLGPPVSKNVSPYTGSPERFRWPNQRWHISVRYARMARAEGEALSAALSASNRETGSFLFGPAGPGKTAKGVATGTPLVNGANQGGEILVTEGWTPNITGILKAGDFIQLASGSTSRLHRILIDVNSDGSGNATLDIEPRLRESPADNSAIVVASPRGLFYLVEVVKWDVDINYMYGFSFEAEEIF